MRLSFQLNLVMLLTPIMAAVGICAVAAFDRDAYQLQVVTDREDATYNVGEPVRFRVTLKKHGQPVRHGLVDFVVDNFRQDSRDKRASPSGQLNLAESSVIEATIERPGFLRCAVTFRSLGRRTRKALSGAAFAPEKISPSMPVPDDFDEFWRNQKTKLSEVPLKAIFSSIDSGDTSLECFDTEIPSLGGAPVRGYYARPKNARPNSLPAILWVHGAGVYSSGIHASIRGARAQMLSMDLNAHGILNGQPAAYYQGLAEGRLKNYWFLGREDRETCYFLGMFLRVQRAIDFLTAQPEWDRQTLVVLGGSQGGGQALAAGGLDRRVTMIGVGIPALCDHTGFAAGRACGWPQFVPVGVDGRPDPVITQVSRYFDGVNFASRCNAEVVASVGFLDTVCPPSSCYAAFNCLSGRKTIINRPRMGHEAPDDLEEIFFQQVLDHIRRQSRCRPEATLE